MTCNEIENLKNELNEIKNTTSHQQTKQKHPYKIGENYFIRTVTHHFTGKLIAVYKHELVLINAAWIADDGRFNIAVSTGTFSEVEPYPNGKEVIIGRGYLIDASILSGPLPREVK